jgi:hypothetical protein
MYTSLTTPSNNLTKNQLLEVSSLASLPETPARPATTSDVSSSHKLGNNVASSSSRSLYANSSQKLRGYDGSSDTDSGVRKLYAGTKFHTTSPSPKSLPIPVFMQKLISHANNANLANQEHFRKECDHLNLVRSTNNDIRCGDRNLEQSTLGKESNVNKKSRTKVDKLKDIKKSNKTTRTLDGMKAGVSATKGSSNKIKEGAKRANVTGNVLRTDGDTDRPKVQILKREAKQITSGATIPIPNTSSEKSGPLNSKFYGTLSDFPMDPNNPYEQSGKFGTDGIKCQSNRNDRNVKHDDNLEVLSSSLKQMLNIIERQ